MSKSVNFELLSDNLIHKNGVWACRSVSDVSYPSEGNESCLQIEEHSFWFKHRNALITSLVKSYPPGGMLLDVGGGNGYVALGLQKAGIEVSLLEPGLEGIRNARRRGIVNLVHGTLEDCQFKAGSIAGVGVFDVIEHIKDHQAFLSAIRDILMPEGRIYITVPAHNWLWSGEDSYTGHFRRYDLTSLKNVLGSAGYQVEFASYIFSFLVLPILALRALPYRLRLRMEHSTDRNMREHQVRKGPGHYLLDRAVKWEQMRIDRKLPILFGASCLATARPNRRQ